MNILGIMSGTSLDGLDLALCTFKKQGPGWSYKLLYSETIPYEGTWVRKLESAPGLSGLELNLLDREFGQFIADRALSVVGSGGLKTDLIASHGHTVFHQPGASFTCQIGNPQVIAVKTGILTAGNFRELDILYGGQGAPLVPVGDEHLFGEYDYCLNLGGYANLSYKKDSLRLARDVCPVSALLNHYARELGLPFDRDGKAGRSGNLNVPLLEHLNGLPYYSQEGPGSLSREWLELEIFPLLNEFRLPVTDLLRTLCEHIAIQVSRQVRNHSRVLVTGGGAYNTFLVERITHHTRSDIVIPSPDVVEFKEALVFAFLGLLRLREEINCYASVTGAERDSCSGILYRPE